MPCARPPSEPPQRRAIREQVRHTARLGTWLQCSSNPERIKVGRKCIKQREGTFVHGSSHVQLESSGGHDCSTQWGHVLMGVRTRHGRRRAESTDMPTEIFPTGFFIFLFSQAEATRALRLVAAGGHALLVVLGGLIVGVDDGVGGHTVGVVGLGPGVDGVDVIEHGHGKEGEHLSCCETQTGR